MITSPSRIESSRPLVQVGMPNEACKPDAMLLLCGRLPLPNELMTIAAAKNTASHFMLRPRSM